MPVVASEGSVIEVFAAALGLGLTSFGGPIAHLGYFERTYVGGRQWLSAEDYAGLVALCQMVPGPASSQVGFLIGLRRAGWPGGLAAWLGFTLPSAVLMLVFALLAPRLTTPLAQAAMHGLKLVAVPIVAQAVWSMGRRLAPDIPRAALALVAVATLLLARGPLTQLLVLAMGAVGGMILCRRIESQPAPPELPIGRRTAFAAGAAFVLLLAGLPLAARASPHSMLSMIEIFYSAGALVFGGGHVVLPLLRDALVPAGWLSDNGFLAGYGAAQAVPGPLFTFGAYLGAIIAPHGAGDGVVIAWSAIAMISLFLPGMLAAVAGLPLWHWIGARPAAQGALAGVNAAVVGVLAAALYNPIWTSAIHSVVDFAIALVGFLLLTLGRLPPIVIVGLCVGAAAITR